MTSGPPKTDGQMMNCCTAYPGSSDQLYKAAYVQDSGPGSNGNSYSSCYDPSLHGNTPCPVDRNGNSIFACFPSSESVGNCRSSCARGHPQDYQFPLYNPEYDLQANELPIAERGVELYENYGLTTDIRNDATRFGDDSIGSSSTRSEMTCASDLGRKVSLFGNVDFAIRSNVISVGTPSQVTTLGTDKVIALGGVDVYYILTVWTDYSSTNVMSRYQYFGNHGITFNYAGQKLTYIHGQMNNLPEVGYSTFDDHTVYYISAWQILRTYFGLTDNYVHPESLKMVNGNVNNPLNSPGTDSRCNDIWNFKTAGSAAVPFPLPWTHSYFQSPNGDTDKSAWNCPDPQHNYNTPSNPFNCYASGIKSFYIPPHMEITAVQSVGKTGALTNKTQTLRSENSKYNNGTFPAYGSASVSGGENGPVTTNRDTPIDFPVGSICGVSVRVRQDNSYYNTYVQPVTSKFAPEILLIPGLAVAANFAGTLSVEGVKSKLGNSLQMLVNPQDFWSANNPYWQGGTVQLNMGFTPGQVLYGSSDLPPTAMPPSDPNNPDSSGDGSSINCAKSKLGFSTKSGFTSNNYLSIASKITGTGKAVMRELKARSRAIARNTPISLVVDTSADTPIGYYRVRQFDVINGVYSLEWLYVLYYCAMNGRKVSYNPDTGLYETPNCIPSSNNSCAKQCMLFRDDYSYYNPDSPVCAADMVMQAYCGMRNLSLAYFAWQQSGSILTNDCSCLTQKSYCPAAFNSNCSTVSSNTSTYVTSDMAKCTDTNICSYCTVTVNQVIMGLASCVEDSDNSLNNFGDQCSNNTTNCTSVNTGTDTGTGTTTNTGTVENPPPPPPDDTPAKTLNWKFLIVILILVIGLVVAVYFGSKKFGRSI